MKEKEKQVLGLLGLATKAGKTKFGAGPCTAAIESGKAELLLIASDAGGNTKKKAYVICEKNKIICLEYSTKENYGKYTGNPEKALAAITDKSFSQRIERLISEDKKYNYRQESLEDRLNYGED